MNIKKSILFSSFFISFLFISCNSKPVLEMIKIPDTYFSISKTEVTQKQYKKVMKCNPSFYKGDNYPVNYISWYDAVVFCNKLSIKENLSPVYSVNGETNPAKWNYNPHKGEIFSEKVIQNFLADGYRLPLYEEWYKAAAGGKDYVFSGSEDVSEVAWLKSNSDRRIHEVATKAPNAYGIYDMSGNVWEWNQDLYLNTQRRFSGGSFEYIAMYQRIDKYFFTTPVYRGQDLGFRVVKNENR